jgi:drug/metabolite transporter (DMT)-like permease
MNVLSTDPDGRPLTGALWMLASGLCFVGVTATVKAVAGDMPAAQSAFLRFALGLVFVLPVLRVLIRDWPGGRDLGLFALRGALHTGAVICWFFAMTRIPLAEVTAMGYLTPVFTALGAALILGETLRLRRIAAIAAAIVGALIVLRPGIREVADGHIAMVGTTLCFALSYLVAKPLTGRHSAAVVVAMLSITVTIGLAPVAAAVWVPVSLEELGGMFLVASFATAGHYCMTRAFAAAPITVTQPVTALQLVWSVLIGSLFFGESVDMFVVAGGSVIVGAVVFIALRERAVARAARRDRDAAREPIRADPAP